MHDDGSGESGLAAGTATLHDALCIAYLIDPSVVTLSHHNVVIETYGRHTVGKTVVDVTGAGDGAKNAWVALQADPARFFALLEATFSGAAS